MFRHIVMLKFADDSESGLNRESAINIKAGLEELGFIGKGVMKIEVHIDPARTPTVDADILIDCCFESRKAFDEYLLHPRYLAVKELIEGCIGNQMCMDYQGHP